MLPKSVKRPRKSPEYHGFDQDDSSGESTNSGPPPNWLQRRQKRRVGDIESLQPSLVQSIIDTAAQIETIPKPYPSPVIREASPTDTRIRPDDNFTID